MKPVRITAVSYLNTKPFIYGIYRSDLADRIELSLDIPSECARKLRDGEADLALTPVAILPELGESYLVSDFCIGATGKVKTVCIFSEKPLEDIREIHLDFHSRTSVALTRVLCASYWNIQPKLVQAVPGFENSIKGDTAGLIIGDRAIGKDREFPYVYDLGEAWAAWTGLPFVFAAWVSTKPLPADFVADFNEALQFGIDRLPELIKVLPGMPDFDLEAYFKENISYHMDDAKWEALNRFLGYLAAPDTMRIHRKLPAASWS